MTTFLVPMNRRPLPYAATRSSPWRVPKAPDLEPWFARSPHEGAPDPRAQLWLCTCRASGWFGSNDCRWITERKFFRIIMTFKEVRLCAMTSCPPNSRRELRYCFFLIRPCSVAANQSASCDRRPVVEYSGFEVGQEHLFR